MVSLSFFIFFIFILALYAVILVIYLVYTKMTIATNFTFLHIFIEGENEGEVYSRRS